MHTCQSPLAHQPRCVRLSLAAALGLAAISACSPTLDWRELQPASSHVKFLLPCKPDTQQRRVPLAGATELLAMHACSADGQTWALAYADVVDPARLGPVLQALMESARVNIGGAAGRDQPSLVSGATPHTQARRAGYEGQLPDGKKVVMDVSVFAYGTRVYQATVLGPRVSEAAVETFLESIQFVH